MNHKWTTNEPSMGTLVDSSGWLRWTRQVIRIIRVTRLLRILRIMRLVRFVRSLRNLVSSIAPWRTRVRIATAKHRQSRAVADTKVLTTQGVLTFGPPVLICGTQVNLRPWRWVLWSFCRNELLVIEKFALAWLMQKKCGSVKNWWPWKCGQGSCESILSILSCYDQNLV